MIHIRAILAGALITLLAAGPGRADVLDEPVRIEFRLTDGVRIRGKMTEWTRHGFDGDFGKRYWIELMPMDTWRVVRHVIDPKSASQWIDFGAILLTLPDMEDRAEYCFRRALELAPDVAAAIDQARADAAAEAARIAEEEARRAAQRLSAQTPEAEPWPADPWPVQTRAQQETARLAMLNDAQQIITEHALQVEVLESEAFILCTDASRERGAKWAIALDRHYKSMLELFGLEPNAAIFWGKPLVFIFTDQDRFRLLEADVFRQLVATDQLAITHYSGPKAFINAWYKGDDVLFDAAVAHEVAHAFMHRLETPRRLPAWANEGIAELMAQRVLDDSPMYDGVRPHALQLIRAGAHVGAVLEMRYDDGSFPGPRNEGYAIGHLLIEFLVRKGRDDAFVNWVRAVKNGTDWREALATYYNATPESLIESFTQFYRVND